MQDKTVYSHIFFSYERDKTIQMWSLLILLHIRSICKHGHVYHWCAMISVAVIAVTPSFLSQICNTSEAVKVRRVLELNESEVKGIMLQNNMHFCAHGNSAYG